MPASYDSVRRRSRALGVLAVASLTALLAACLEDRTGPYAEIAGGGFIFNYRGAEAFYGVSLKRLRTLPRGTVIEAAFENPAGGPALIVRETVLAAQPGWRLSTPPLTGIVAERTYKVIVVLRAPDETVLQRLERTFRSDLSQDVLPDQPLTVGPGYTPNPDAFRKP